LRAIYNPGVYPRWRETIFFPFLWRHRATSGATLRQNHSTHVSKSQAWGFFVAHRVPNHMQVASDVICRSIAARVPARP
jgi:predicted component of type VI protein secretion system